MVVRNEADVLETSLAHHFAHGVDLAVVADNRSEDGTREILRRHEAAGRVAWYAEDADDYDQGAWVTRLCDRARREHGADWLLVADADELWTPAEGATDLKEVVERATAPALEAPHTNLVRVLAEGEADDAPLAAHDYLAVVRPIRRPDLRAALRTGATTDTLVPEGLGWIFWSPADSRILIRAADVGQVRLGNDVERRRGPLRRGRFAVSHLPIRRFAQFEAKVRLGATALAGNASHRADRGSHWRWWLEVWRAGRLREEFETLVIRGQARMDALRAQGVVAPASWPHWRGLAGSIP